MPRYEEDNFGGNMRQKDLVLSVNEYVFIQSKTNGQIRTYTGPIMVTISAQESMVVFDPKTKKFEETTDFNRAKQLFTSAPEGWYVMLKNPTDGNEHPESGKAVNSPTLQVGKKINISGPCSFSLYPGQMAKVVRGHRLKTNQYLIARVYDSDAAEKNSATIVDADGNKVNSSSVKYYVGQQLVIKGTEVSFYIPPTGIEVVPADDGEYVRDAVTLERLEYAILKDEDGEKKYAHGPAVVFPEPTQTFVTSPKGGVIFRALELSPISGIYVKVIADYTDEDGGQHNTGEEIFITGNQQMIYYPRPEHAMIEYDGKYMHHAIAIPKGEGRYILDRIKGDIKTVVGPAMYLPDPRTEVVVKRKLSEKECNMLYPGNTEVLQYNNALNEKAVEKMAKFGKSTASTDALNDVYYSANQEKTLAIFEVNANISRGTSYTKPRTITLDTKYDGVVSVDVWDGYAIQIVSKSGDRKTVIGPKTEILDYDQTVSAVNGKAFLPISNNRITDTINVITKDYVNVDMKVVYTVDFDDKKKDKWFSVENFESYIINKMRPLVKKEARNYTVEEIVDKADEVVEKASGCVNGKSGKTFEDNGCFVKSCEVIKIDIDEEIREVLNERNVSATKRSIELSDAEQKTALTRQIEEFQKQEADIVYANTIYKQNLSNKIELEKLAAEAELSAKKRAEDEAEKKAESDMQKIIDEIELAKRNRTKAEADLEYEENKRNAELLEAQQKSYAETVAKIMGSISEDLVAAMNTKANEELSVGIAKAVSPYSIANGESISETVDRLLRGTSIHDVLKNILKLEDETNVTR